MHPKLSFTASAFALLAIPSLSAADATIYGKAHVSVDYVDADADAAWNRPAAGAPSFDVMSFIHDANQALNDAGYVAALPPPRDLDTVVGDLLFGTIQFDALDALTQERILDAVDDALTPGHAFRGWGLNANDRASRIGVKGSEDLSNGLKAIYQIELDIPMADTDYAAFNGDRGRIRMRNSFVGLASPWGTLLVGRHDTPTKISTGRLDLFADTLADYNYTVGFNDLRADNSLLYISPSLWGLQLAGAVIPGGGSTATGIRSTANDDIAAGWSVALSYQSGPFYASAAYELLGSAFWATQDGAYDIAHAVFADDESKWRIGLGLLDWQGFSLSGIYESRTNVLGMPVEADAELWQVQAGYALGNNLIKAMYGQADLGACADPWNIGFRYTCTAGVIGQAFPDRLSGVLNQQDKSTWAIGFDHNFSKRTKVYTLYTAVRDDNENADWSGFSLGMMHSF
jgi:predicted porin